MLRAAGAIILMMLGSGASAAETDFGIRELGQSVRSSEPPPAGTWASHSGSSVDIGNISQIGARWGQVTSTYPQAGP